MDSKNKTLQDMVCTKNHVFFKCVNDVVLDKIEEINILDSKKYPKLYDVTVPDTLNFVLANGLNIRDTSSSGYLQR
jgi:intein/homing endonuclease